MEKKMFRVLKLVPMLMLAGIFIIAGASRVQAGTSTTTIVDKTYSPGGSEVNVHDQYTALNSLSGYDSVSVYVKLNNVPAYSEGTWAAVSVNGTLKWKSTVPSSSPTEYTYNGSASNVRITLGCNSGSVTVKVTGTKTTADAHTHSYSTPTITFASDGKSATYKQTCSGCSQTWTGSCSVSKTGTTAGNCTTQATATYTATASSNGKTNTATKTVNTGLGSSHTNIQNPVITFASDGKSATYTQKCSACGKQIASGNATVKQTGTTTGTCKVQGTVTYTATVTANSKTATLSKTVNTGLGAHTGIQNPVVTFNGYTATYTQKCTTCNTQIASGNATVTSVITKWPTYYESGVRTFTGKITANGKTGTATTTQTLSQLTASLNKTDMGAKRDVEGSVTVTVTDTIVNKSGGRPASSVVSTTYQWERSADGVTYTPISNGSGFSGATSATLKFTPQNYDNTLKYVRCSIKTKNADPENTTTQNSVYADYQTPAVNVWADDATASFKPVITKDLPATSNATYPTYTFEIGVKDADEICWMVSHDGTNGQIISDNSIFKIQSYASSNTYKLVMSDKSLRYKGYYIGFYAHNDCGDTYGRWSKIEYSVGQLAPQPGKVNNINTIETGSMTVEDPAIFPDAEDTAKSYNWYLLLDDGNGNSNPAQFREMLSVDPSESAVIACLNQASGVQAAQNAGYAINTGGKNMLMFESRHGIPNDTFKIADLNKDLDGCWFTYSAHNTPCPEGIYPGDSDPNIPKWFKLNIISAANTYPYTEIINDDPNNTINWQYGLNADGEIVTLYTTDKDLSSIIDKDGVLHVPTTINGLIVRGIGSGTQKYPFVPTTTKFSSIDFPKTLTTIQDYAFAGNGHSDLFGGQQFDVVLPSTLTAVHDKAFYCSNIRSLIDNCGGANAYMTFADTPNMQSAVFNTTGSRIGVETFEGSGVKSVQFNGEDISIGQNAFRSSGLTELYLPGHTGQIEGNAFADSADLKVLQTEVDLTSGTFAGCPIEVVIVEGPVRSIDWDWAGSGSDNLIRNVKWVVRNNRAKFEGSMDGTPFSGGNTSGAATANIYYEAATNDFRDSYSTGSGTVEGICALIDKSNDTRDTATEDSYIPYYITGSAGDVALVFHNGGHIPSNGEDAAEYEAKKDAAKADFDAGIKALEDLGQDLKKRDGVTEDMTGIAAECTRTIFYFPASNEGEILEKDDVKVTKVGGAYSGGMVTPNQFVLLSEDEWDMFKTFLLSKQGNTSDGTGILTGMEDKVRAELGTVGQYQGKISPTKNDFDKKNAKEDKYGTIYGYAIVPNNLTAEESTTQSIDGEGEGSNLTTQGAYVARFAVTVEKYKPDDYAMQKYGGFKEILDAIIDLDNTIKDYEKEVDAYNDLLRYVQEFLKEYNYAGGTTLNDLKEAYQTLSDRYNNMTMEEKETEEGKGLKKEIDTLALLITKGEALADMEAELMAKREELAKLNNAEQYLNNVLRQYQIEMDQAGDTFTYIFKDETGEIVGYKAFIDGHEYRWEPEEDDPTYTPPGEFMQYTLHTAYCDDSVEPGTEDLDGNGDGRFQYYIKNGKAYIKDSDKIYPGSFDNSVREAEQILNEMNSRLIAYNKSVGATVEEMKKAINAIKAAGYDVDVADDASNDEMMKAINDAIIEIIDDYNSIKEAISGDPNAKPEDVLEDLKDLQQKLEDLQKQLDELLGISEEDKEKIASLTDKVRALIDDYQRLQEEDAAKLQEAADRIADLEGQLADAQSALDQMQVDLEDSQAELEQAKSDLEQKQAELEQELADHEKTKEELAETQAELERVNEELANIQAELEEAKKNQMSEEDMQKLKDAEAAALAAQKEADDLRAQIAEMLAKGTISEETAAKLNEQIDKYKEEIYQLLRQNAYLTGTNEAYVRDNQKLFSDTDSLRGRVDSLLEDKAAMAVKMGEAEGKASASKNSSSGSDGGGGSRSSSPSYSAPAYSAPLSSSSYVPNSTQGKTPVTTTTKTVETTTKPVDKDGKDSKSSSSTEKIKETEKTVVDKENCKHEWEYKDNGDRTHTKTCKLCKETVTENHAYDDLTKKCVCGAVEKTSVELKKVENTVDQSTCEHDWEYKDNGDGTHTQTCKKCKLIKTTVHQYDENGVCACGNKDVKKDEEKSEEKAEEPVEQLQAPKWTKSTSTETSETAETEGDKPEDAETEEATEEGGGFPVGLVVAGIIIVGAIAFFLYKFVLKGKKGKEDEDDFDDDGDDFISSDEDSLMSDEMSDGMSDEESDDSFTPETDDDISFGDGEDSSI